MTIHRIEKTSNFTVISNAVLTDCSISLTAKGLLLQMLSRPDNWRFSEKRLTAGNKEGISVIKRALAELQTAGYLQRRRMRDTHGVFSGCCYDIFECPTGKSTYTAEQNMRPAGWQKRPSVQSVQSVQSVRSVQAARPAAAASAAAAATAAAAAATAPVANMRPAVWQERPMEEHELHSDWYLPATAESPPVSTQPALEAVYADASVVTAPAAAPAAVVASSPPLTESYFAVPASTEPLSAETLSAETSFPEPWSAEPYSAEPLSADPRSGFPMSGFPTLGFPSAENPLELINTEVTRTDITNTERIKTEKDNNQIIREIDKTDEIVRARAFRRMQLQENIDYRYVLHDTRCGQDILDELVELMLDISTSSKEFVRIGGEELPGEIVRQRFLELNGDHIRYVLECLNNNCTKVHNIRQYLLTALYNAPTSINNYYAAEVRYDFYGKARSPLCS